MMKLVANVSAAQLDPLKVPRPGGKKRVVEAALS
jgi:hypothetical protein